jgi:copper chaperone CopZ
MTRFIRASLLLAAVLVGTAASATTLRIEVNGLVCAFCAQGIDKTLRALPATADVVVSLEKKLVGLALKPGQTLDDAVVTKAITDAGYAVVKITRSEESLDAVRAELKTK